VWVIHSILKERDCREELDAPLYNAREFSEILSATLYTQKTHSAFCHSLAIATTHTTPSSRFKTLTFSLFSSSSPFDAPMPIPMPFFSASPAASAFAVFICSLSCSAQAIERDSEGDRVSDRVYLS
jgi:hypothetical protein